MTRIRPDVAQGGLYIAVEGVIISGNRTDFRNQLGASHGVRPLDGLPRRSKSLTVYLIPPENFLSIRF